VRIGSDLFMGMLARMYRKAGPNEALIVYGFRGPRVIKGHGTVIFPMVENCRELSLELMSFDVAPQQDLYTKQGVAVTVEAVAQIKVRSDQAVDSHRGRAVPDQDAAAARGLIRLVMEGHLRGIIGQLTVEQIVKEPEMVGERMRATCAEDMSKMGLEVISFTIKEVRDKNEYISNMGRPDVARIKRDAEMATAEAERDTAIKRANALREVRRGQGAGRPGAGDCRDRVANAPGRGAARSGHQEGAVPSRAAASRPRPTRRTNCRPTSCCSR
jgi:flotillin